MRNHRLFLLTLVFLTTISTAQYRKKGNVYLNNLTATPGATVVVSLDDLCTPGYTSRVRNVSAATKKEVCAEYAVPLEHCTGTEVEIDHLISLELGGSNDPSNLWPEPYLPKPGAREKDRLENWFHKQVCNSKMPLAVAQRMIATDWYSAYQMMLQSSGTAPFSSLMAENVPAESDAPAAPLATDSGAEGTAFDFAIAPDFLAKLESGHTIQPTLTIRLAEHSPVHPLNQDCELHVAGVPQNVTLGDPNAIVVEPPNVCKNNPGDAGSSATDWSGVFDPMAGVTCQVTGFPRIFTEHAKSGGGQSNPSHVFEIHPATAIDCGQQPLAFGNLLTIFPGMRAISPTTATSCITQRQLFVRYDSDKERFVFREQGGQCGNFAVVEVQTVLASSVRKIGGGHSAIARVSPDGQSLATLKLYTLSPSVVDQWLDGASSSTGIATSRVFLHGLFTYDYFAIQKVLHPQGQDWQKPPDWTPVRFPLAFVIFGQVDSAPWDEQ